MKIINNPQLVDFVKLESFILEHPHGNFFQSTKAFKFFQTNDSYKPFLIVAISGADIVGSLLAVIIDDGRSLKKYLSRRCIVWGGPIVKDQDKQTAFLLLNALNKQIKKKAIYTQFRNIYSMEHLSISFKRAHFSFDEHLDFFFDLKKGEKNLWANIHKNRKKEIKKGIKGGLEVEKISLANNYLIIEELYLLLEKLYSKIGLPYPSLEFFLSAAKLLEPENILHTFVAKIEDRIIGFRMALAYKGLIYDWYAASDESFLKLRPNDVLPWEVLKWGALNGYQRFSFGGAGKPNVPYGVRDYKMRFGGTLANYGRFIKINQKILFIIGKIGLKLFRYFKAMGSA